jgi:carboxyl-terminal processing protease
MKINISILYRPLLYFIFASVLFTAACNKDDEPEPFINEENEEFFEFMKDWYFWNDNIPNINPSSYENIFEVLEAIRFRPLDRWSFIIDWQEFEAYFQDSRFIGYGFGSSWDSNGKLRISFIHDAGDLYKNGVRRGWIVESINGTAISQGVNVNQLLGPNEEGISNTFVFRKPDNSTIEMTVVKKEIITNTVLHHEILEAENIKIGYMVLQSFREPTEEELNNVFADFYAEGIDELILDMRYNGGGLTRIATQLASLISGPALAGQPFAKTVYNAGKENQYNRTDNFQNLENSLGITRLITIATRATASASEMIINGLSPYIDVYVVGNTTYGKPMGSNVFNYDNTWALAPITFKVRNANDEGDYFDGLSVDIPAPDDLTRDFGDPQETSLQAALAFILTGSTKGAPVMEPLVRQPWEDMKGLRWESRSH